MSTPFRFDETAQQAHGYRHLIARWRRVARGAGLKLEAFAEAADCSVFCVRTRGEAKDGLYLSAGIHGDEPAGAAGLLHWAEMHLGALVRARPGLPLFILPCLNPWGLSNNQRGDRQGRDLNRLFDKARLAPIGELKKLLAGRRFALGLMLHEDYDGRGTYLYEIHRQGPAWGPELLKAACPAVPIDVRRRIDGRPFSEGCALRLANLRRIRLHPEAIYLYANHTDRAITFETPSEFALARRVHAQVLLIEACIRRL